jgi:hypothetical protein
VFLDSFKNEYLPISVKIVNGTIKLIFKLVNCVLAKPSE